MLVISLSRVFKCPLDGVDTNNMLHYLCTPSVASETDLLGLSGVDSGLSVQRDLPEAMGSSVQTVERGMFPKLPAQVAGCLVFVSCMAPSL